MLKLEVPRGPGSSSRGRAAWHSWEAPACSHRSRAELRCHSSHRAGEQDGEGVGGFEWAEEPNQPVVWWWWLPRHPGVHTVDDSCTVMTMAW